jgi:hypothetical protein
MKRLLRGLTLTLILMVSLSWTSLGSQITELIEAGVGTPITKTIQHLQPALSWDEANRHAWIIYTEAERTGIPWQDIVAIAMQESSFRFMRGDRTCGLTAHGEETCVYRAFGPMHVYWEYWKDALRLDSWRFTNDLQYQYQAGVAVLERRWKQYRSLGPAWIGTYNSTTPRHRDQYAAFIDEHRNRIQEFLHSQIIR